MRKCTLSDSVSFFGFFFLPTAKTLAQIFTISTSNDVVSRKNVPIVVPKTKFYISTPFPPPKKNAKFWPIFERT